MRRLLAAMTVAALMITATAVLASTGVESYRDEFRTVSYSGSDGTRNWGNPWVEIGPGTNGQPASGVVRVEEHTFCADDKCLVIGGPLVTVATGARRFANLGDFEDAVLSYDVACQSVVDLLGVVLASPVLTVEVTSNNGVTWAPVDSYCVGASGGQVARRTVRVDTWISDGFGVRFTMTGALGTAVFIDNVEVRGTVTQTTTTTTQATTPTTQATTPTTQATTPTTQATTTTSGSTSNVTTISTNGDTTTPTSREQESTTEEAPEEETTTRDSDDGLIAAVDPAEPPTGPSFGDGIRITDNGLQANFRPGLFGSVGGDGPQVLGASLAFDYRMAVEAIEAAWLQVLVLAAVIAGVLVAGLDRRSSRRLTAQYK